MGKTGSGPGSNGKNCVAGLNPFQKILGARGLAAMMGNLENRASKVSPGTQNLLFSEGFHVPAEKETRFSEAEPDHQGSIIPPEDLSLPHLLRGMEKLHLSPIALPGRITASLGLVPVPG